VKLVLAAAAAAAGLLFWSDRADAITGFEFSGTGTFTQAPLEFGVIAAPVHGGLAEIQIPAGQLAAFDTFQRLQQPDTALQMRMALDAARRAEEARLRALLRQSQVTPDGCPTSAPPGTLRGGSDRIGIAQLCADSVRAARTPNAARAIIAALHRLGVPYSQPRRDSGGAYYDCSSFVTSAYQDTGTPLRQGGWSPTTFVQVKARWAVPADSAAPGDLVFFGGATPPFGHVGMALAHGFMVHTNRTGDVSHVTRMGSPTAIRWVDPAKV